MLSLLDKYITHESLAQFCMETSMKVKFDFVVLLSIYWVDKGKYITNIVFYDYLLDITCIAQVDFRNQIISIDGQCKFNDEMDLLGLLNRCLTINMKRIQKPREEFFINLCYSLRHYKTVH